MAGDVLTLKDLVLHLALVRKGIHVYKMLGIKRSDSVDRQVVFWLRQLTGSGDRSCASHGEAVMCCPRRVGS